MKLTGAQIVCECLVLEGVRESFGLPGGAVLPLYDMFNNYPQLKHILVRHEQGAAHAADGYARASGYPLRVGVCIATSGPGATNLVTGIATAYMDSSPIIAITGQVARPFIGKDAFQEVDITGITLPITKHNYLVMSAQELPRIIKQAFHLARTGRPGPVHIDIPRDVFLEEAEFHYPEEEDLPGYKPTMEGHPLQIKRAAQLINSSSQPVIIAGRGVNISGAHQELKELAEKSQIPVAATLLGLDTFPRRHFLSLGMLGMHGFGYTNLAISNADLIIAIGMRFDDRATGKVSSFAPRAKVIHIDIDPAEIGKNVKVDVPIVGDVKRVLREINKLVTEGNRLSWLNQIEKWQQQYPVFIPESDSLLPQMVIRSIYEATDGEAVIVTGVGQNQMWAAQYFPFSQPYSLISSGGLGTMGFELPAAIGAKFAQPQKTVWCIAGDGGFQMTMQELAVAAQENVAVKIAILNNGYLGMVRQWQELFYSRRYTAVYLGNPDFVHIAQAYGIPAIRVTDKNLVMAAITKAMAHPGPFLIDFVIEPEENVYPMVPAGKSISEFIESPKKKELVSPTTSLGVSNI